MIIKRPCLIWLIGFLWFLSAYFIQDLSAFDYDDSEKMTYEDLLEQAKNLVATYPDLLRIEILGQSTKGREIVALTLSKGAPSYIGIDAGIHARENIGSFVLLETLERYVEEISRPGSHRFSYDIHDLIDHISLRAILCANPDGFEQLISYPNWKANANGVDLNRNFACEYYNGVDWISFWGLSEGDEPPYYYSDHPSYAYFSGYSPDSESETKIIKSFYQAYDYRSFLSLHTRGKLIYYERSYLPSLYQFSAKRLATEIQKYNQFTLIDSSTSLGDEYYSQSSGTVTDWLSGHFLKPALTLELMPIGSSQPPPTELRNEALSDFLEVPLAMMFQAVKEDYYDYKVYVNQKFFADYPTSNYAYGVAAKMGGYVAIFKGSPHEWAAANELKNMGIIKGDYRLTDSISHIELITLLIRCLYPMDLVPEVADFKDVSPDHWGHKYAVLARYYGLVTGKYFFPNDLIHKNDAKTRFQIPSESDFLTRGDVFLYLQKRLKELSL